MPALLCIKVYIKHTYLYMSVYILKYTYIYTYIHSYIHWPGEMCGYPMSVCIMSERCLNWASGHTIM